MGNSLFLILLFIKKVTVSKSSFKFFSSSLCFFVLFLALCPSPTIKSFIFLPSFSSTFLIKSVHLNFSDTSQSSQSREKQRQGQTFHSELEHRFGIVNSATSAKVTNNNNMASVKTILDASKKAFVTATATSPSSTTPNQNYYNHILFLVHGYQGTGDDLLYVKESIENFNRDLDFFFY